MPSFAAVMTGPGAGAIASIQLAGDAAPAVLAQVFRPAAGEPPRFETGRILLGRIVDGAETIDQVTVGCEGPGSFAIHCHGNPLLLEAIVTLLERHGVELLPAARLLVACGSGNAIADEARLALTTVRTLAGARLIAHQVEAGLSQKVRQWLRQLESGTSSGLADEVRHILRDSETARLLIEGCTVALIGPPGAGKSTLLNTLAGREKAIVTGIKGTTRDWISAEIHLPPLAVTLIDTAGIVAAEDGIDQAAQVRSLEVLDRADVVLLVLDVHESVARIDVALSERLSAKKVIPVLNKADLPARLPVSDLSPYAHAPVHISAKHGAGIDEVAAAVVAVTGATDLDLCTPVAFTLRQRRLLEHVPTDPAGAALVRLVELLRGPPGIQDATVRGDGLA